MGAHALLSASSAHRWIHCSPSARLEETFENTTSIFAEEGTFMHELGELKLSKYVGAIKQGIYKKKLKELQLSKFYNPEIDEAVDVYVNFAIELIEGIKQRCKDPIILLEQRLDFSRYVERGFGTGDLVIVADGTLEIVDLKGGKGVAVSADHNPQMQLYALGALTLFDCLYDIKTVRMTICQPRMDNISTYELSAEELLTWAEIVLKPAAQSAWNGEGEFDPSEYTCKFCRAKATCRARSDKNLEIAYLDFKAPPLLEDEEIIKVLKAIGELQKWASDVKDYAFNKAIHEGKRWNGFKLVEGKSSRKYTDESAVAKTLIESGYEANTIYLKSLLGITAMEKVIGKKVFSEILKDLIEKPNGKPTLVLETDKRLEINNTTETDFKEEI